MKKDPNVISVLVWVALMLGAFAVCLIILSGEAYADPPTEEHSVMHHPPLPDLLFCTAGYLRLWNEIKWDPGTDSLTKMNVQARGKGLVNEMLGIALANGHTFEELDQQAISLYEIVGNMDEVSWLLVSKEIGCRQMSERYRIGNDIL